MQRYPLSRALLIITLSILIVSGTAGLLTLFWAKLQYEWKHDPAYQIVSIIQKTPHKERLENSYLADLLGLKGGVNLYAFNSRQGEKVLLKHPLIKQASIRKKRPGTLEIEYELYLPVALIGDRLNTGLTKEGVLIPLYPFFKVSSLPTFYVGNSLSKEKKELLRSLTQAVKPFGSLKSLNISEETREYRLLLATPAPHCLRLPSQGWEKALAHYGLLWENLEKEQATIDLRIEGMALIHDGRS